MVTYVILLRGLMEIDLAESQTSHSVGPCSNTENYRFQKFNSDQGEISKFMYYVSEVF